MGTACDSRKSYRAGMSCKIRLPEILVTNHFAPSRALQANLDRLCTIRPPLLLRQGWFENFQAARRSYR
jgi:hypothetical protein